MGGCGCIKVGGGELGLLLLVVVVVSVLRLEVRRNYGGR